MALPQHGIFWGWPNNLMTPEGSNFLRDRDREDQSDSDLLLPLTKQPRKMRMGHSPQALSKRGCTCEVSGQIWDVQIAWQSEDHTFVLIIRWQRAFVPI